MPQLLALCRPDFSSKTYSSPSGRTARLWRCGRQRQCRKAAKLTRTQLRSLLKKASRQRGIETEAERLRDALRAPQTRQSPQVEQAMGRQAIALLRQLDAACTNVDDLAQAPVR